MSTTEASRTLRRLFASTPGRTFFLYPICVIAFELAVRRGDLIIVPWGVVLLLWGYLQYRWAGDYRVRRGGGGPGLAVPPERLVTNGPYAYTRNPMYLGHLIFMLGTAVTFWSLLALALFLAHVIWFHLRVRNDETRLRTRFGAQYDAYCARVKRWLPGLF
jgi:protein-S-isoprenylcysteine O-methyltransferase Ste14